MRRLTCEEFDAFESNIDTEYFGIPSARAILKSSCFSEQKQDELLEFLHGYEFIVITNKANNPINNRWIGERTKAFLVDVNLQFQKKVLASETIDENPAKISDNLPDNDQIVQLAETSFKFSRFLNDPYIPNDKARCIYGDYVTNAFGKTGRFFSYTQIEGVITGFLLFSVNRPNASSTIELIAVDQTFRGRGVGQVITRAMENYVNCQKIEKIIVGTQLNNLNALKFYTTYGFKHFECNAIYHYWPLKQL